MDFFALLANGGIEGGSPSIFDSASPAADAISNLSVLVLAVAGLIFLVVEGILFYCVFRFRRRGQDTAEPPQVYGSKSIEIAWTAAPALIVFFLMLVITRTLWEVEVDPPAPRAGDQTLFVTVVGRQWWWEYRYEYYDGRKLGFIAANELHIPVSAEAAARRVYLRLESADVCHSFWVPRLAGKTDLIPGRTNEMWLEAREPGLYVGQCAEYCGTQHAGMLLRVVAEAPGDFARWLAHEAQAAADDPQVRRAREAFLAQSCVNCHRVRGTPAQGGYAPDLTHLMARQTLASGVLENNRENLDRWVRDPQSIKSGCLMPDFKLSDADRQRIVEYLLTLE
ncbi:MAG TPA: cytochrome c oxidase subunit II [Pirellulales bacterium]|jgi:cytochrome c oxidase subunit 2|nr:cytochrome c oxidase subunit II [Pirellulales bacterium]